MGLSIPANARPESPLARRPANTHGITAGGGSAVSSGRIAGAQSLETAQTQFLHGHYAEVITVAQKELGAETYAPTGAGCWWNHYDAGPL